MSKSLIFLTLKKYSPYVNPGMTFSYPFEVEPILCFDLCRSRDLVKREAFMNYILSLNPSPLRIYNFDSLFFYSNIVYQGTKVEYYYAYDQDRYQDLNDYRGDIVRCIRSFVAHEEYIKSGYYMMPGMIEVCLFKEKLLEELMKSYTILRKTGLKKLLHEELEFLPPNNLLKLGGIKYQEGFKEFEDLKKR